MEADDFQFEEAELNASRFSKYRKTLLRNKILNKLSEYEVEINFIERKIIKCEYETSCECEYLLKKRINKVDNLHDKLNELKREVNYSIINIKAFNFLNYLFLHRKS
jgi:predicted nuclease with TOPRIM domain